MSFQLLMKVGTKLKENAYTQLFPSFATSFTPRFGSRNFAVGRLSGTRRCCWVDLVAILLSHPMTPTSRLGFLLLRLTLRLFTGYF